MLSPEERRAKIGAVVRVASGNFLEMYDFIVYGYYATEIGHAFFPAGSAFASLMLSLVTFGAGYLMRPLGAIVLGAYIDRKGRREGLLITLGLMAIGTLTIAATPSYATIGILAPLIVVIGRLLQGLSAGVEIGGVSVYLSEIATPGNRGFYCSWQSASQQVAVVFTSLLGLALVFWLPADKKAFWAWRIALGIGCLIIPIILWLRRSLEETEAFKRMHRHPHKASDVLRILGTNWQVVVVGVMLSVMTTTSFYLITAYTPTFGAQALHLSQTETFLVTLCVGASNFLWLPIGGTLSDRVGRRPILLVIPALAIVTAYPVMLWLVAAPTMLRLLLVVLWFSMFFGLYSGAMIPFLTEIMPPEVRTAGFSVAFSLAAAVFGGFTPAVCTFLIKFTGNKASPALWLSLAAVIGLTGALLSRRWRADENAERNFATEVASAAKPQP
jgi:MFS transporter, MHS family, citrate/tricarballylate:H+ symporter